MRRTFLRVDSVEENNRADHPQTLAAAPHLAAADRRAGLAVEARRVGKHSVIAEVAALRRSLREKNAGEDPLRLAQARMRSVQLRRRFHRVIDGLVDAGGFEQAMEILRDRRRRLDTLIVHCRPGCVASED